MFKIEIKDTRARSEICSKLTIRIPDFFSIVDFEHVFVCWVVIIVYCLDDFHCLDHFHCVHDLQKNCNLVYILKLA